MQVTFIPSEEINSDLGIVNAARVSLGKKSEVLNENDKKLISYLAKHNHWTPFAHSRLHFDIKWKHYFDQLYFYKNANHAGMCHIELANDYDCIKGSLYFWLNNWQFLPSSIAGYVIASISEKYPCAVESTIPELVEPIEKWFNSGATHILEEYISFKKYWNLACATLLIKVPIFIARQIRTSQVGFACSDLYVENESFVFNEVSRRYVNDEPEFYEIQQWRTREGKNVKQGSTGLMPEAAQQSSYNLQEDTINQALCYYKALNDNYFCAPEQARALLPQSMYTEFYMTGTLHRWSQFLQLRLDSHVQEETRHIANMIYQTLASNFPRWNESYNF